MQGSDWYSSFWNSEFLWLFIWLINQNGFNTVNSWLGRDVTTMVLVPVSESWHLSFITSLQHPSKQEWRMFLLFNPISELFCWLWLWLTGLWEDESGGEGEAYKGKVYFLSVLTIFGLPPHFEICNLVCKTLTKPQNALATKQKEGESFIAKILLFCAISKEILLKHHVYVLGFFFSGNPVPVHWIIRSAMYLTWILFLLLLCQPQRLQVIEFKKKKQTKKHPVPTKHTKTI